MTEPEPTVLRFYKDGPVRVIGDTQVDFGSGPHKASGDVFLCRCGASKTRPYCDAYTLEDFRCIRQTDK